MSIKKYLTYDDVLLLPKYSEVLPTEVDTSLLCQDFKFSTPIFSSAMDTVTEFDMAHVMSQLGGAGILHKNCTIDQQVQWVKELKKLKPESSTSTQNKNGELIVAAAVGASPQERQRASALAQAGVDILVVDTAHGHSKGVGEMVDFIKKNFSVWLVAGNVATPQGCTYLIEKGADAVKVGIGPGSICTTRQVSGVGVPQLQALLECGKVIRAAKKYMIADGGLKTSGDVVKALAAGAHFVMIGSLLAGTEEAPGELVTENGVTFKSYRGMGSLEAMALGSKDRYGQASVEQVSKLVAEGVSGKVKAKGSAQEIIYQLTGGLRSGMGYLGAKNLEELFLRAEFIEISSAALLESRVHSLD